MASEVNVDDKKSRITDFFASSVRSEPDGIKSKGLSHIADSCVLLTPEGTPPKPANKCADSLRRAGDAKQYHGKPVCHKLYNQDCESRACDSDSEINMQTVKQTPGKLSRSTSDSVLDSPRPTQAKVKRCQKAKDTEPVANVSRGRRKKENSSTIAVNGPSKTSQARSKTTGGCKKHESQNHKVTDYFPVRRSTRMCATDLKKMEQEEIEEAILLKRETGMKVTEIAGKGRGVVATKVFRRGDFVVEYAGDLIDLTTAKTLEKKYSAKSDVGCYMYYFNFHNKSYCVNATEESGRVGRLVNHSRTAANCTTRIVGIGDRPYLILVAAKTICVGDELLYDYGDRSKSSLEAHPWLSK